MAIKFVSLHNHDGYSIYDALGTPKDLAEWNLKNAGEDSGAFAVTNHGNISSAGHMAALQKNYKKKGVPQKILWGCEAYYLPSIDDWRSIKAAKDLEKEEKKNEKKKASDDTDLVIENEAESKSKYFDPINRRNHLVLVAQNQTGLKNLFRLVTRSYTQGFYRKPRIDLEMLKELNEGIIASTACIAGVPSWCSLQHSDDMNAAMNLYDKELLPLMEVFGKERFYLELQFNKLDEQQLVNRHLIEYAKRTGYKLIATADCHYPEPQMYKDREIYRLLGYQMQKKNTDLSVLEKSLDEIEAQLYLKNGDQMFQTYRETFAKHYEDDQLVIEALERTYDIAHNFIEEVIPNDDIKLPKTFQVTQKVLTPLDKLKELVIKGLRDRGLDSKKEYVERAIYELKVIKDLGVAEYFLTLKQMLDTVRQEMLTGVARGSGTGSLVNYLLGITFLDPVKNNLVFERFMSPSRKEMPDIDSDLEDKELAFEIIKEHFGDESVVAISNYNRLKLKSLVKDVAKLYGVSFEEVNAVTKVIEKEARKPIMEEIGHDQKLYDLTYEKAYQYSPTFREFVDKYPQMKESLENLKGALKAISKHAGGMIVVPKAEDCMPVIRIRNVNQSPISEGITAQHLKHFGLIKFDMLGLATLRIIRRCIEIVLRDQGNKRPTITDVWDFYNKYLHPDVLDPADEKVFEKVYHSGKFLSIFQFEQPRVQGFCMKAHPESVHDISNITALWRPGPLSGGADKKYLFYEEHKYKNEHPIVKEVMGRSRYLILFQEQFMMLAHKLAGFTLEESDKLRKLLVKPSLELSDEMIKEREEAGKKFISGCIEKGLTKERAEHLWEKEIMGFISYGFSENHSLPYAYNSYQCAWLLTYYEKAWIRACLEMDPDLEKTINTTRAAGFVFNKVDVNTSPVQRWEYEQGTWNPPLTSLKGVGVVAARELLANRPEGGFKDINDFFYTKEGKWRWSKLNKKVVGILMKAEAFGSMGCVGTMFSNYKHMHDFVTVNWDALKKKKMTFEESSLHDCDDWPAAEKIVMQRELTGYFDKGLIIAKFAKTFNEFNIVAIDEAGDVDEEGHEIHGDKYKVWAIVEKIEEKQTKRGSPFLTLAVTGRSNRTYRFKVWNTAKKTSMWNEGAVVVFSLDYDEDYGYSLARGTKPLEITR